MLYYSASSTWKRSCIGYAVSQKVEGPYQHVDTIIYSGFTKTGAVDHGLGGPSSHSDRDTRWDNSYLNLSELIAEGRLSGISDKWFTANGGWREAYAPNAIDPTVFFSKEGAMYMVYGSWSGGLFIHELAAATICASSVHGTFMAHIQMRKARTPRTMDRIMRDTASS